MMEQNNEQQKNNSETDISEQALAIIADFVVLCDQGIIPDTCIQKHAIAIVQIVSIKFPHTLPKVIKLLLTIGRRTHTMIKTDKSITMFGNSDDDELQNILAWRAQKKAVSTY